jgi:hypothetical protein
MAKSKVTTPVIFGVDHTKVTSTRLPLYRKVAKDELRQLDRDIGACRQTLLCAAAALGKAEDQRFVGDSEELAASATRVIERCSRELLRIQGAVDDLLLKRTH